MPEHKSYLITTDTDGPYVPNPKSLDGVPDLCMLTYLGELNILHNLKCRYEKREIYTSTTAKVLVALNPYEAKPEDYTEAKMKAYQEQATNLEGLADKNSLPPHLFWVSNSAYQNLLHKKVNQSIIVCGESGAGKTESAKYMMRFLAFTTTSNSADPSEFAEAEKVGQQVLDANPILESFGNAKTLINNNSSRFGKFTKMLFQEGKKKGALKLAGAGIETYLLEKSRVVYQDKGERNYHIFYQLTHCHDKHPELKLGPATKFAFTSKSGCDTLEDLRYPGNTADVNWHKELETAWETLKVPREDSLATYKIVAGILKLGNITFKDRAGEGSDIEQPELVKDIAELWKVDLKQLTKRIETRTLYLPGGKTLIKPLNKGDAEFNRDSMCRNIYNGMFRWVVWRINQVSFPGECNTYIGILDVFGFEIFANNSFEQFCINFANERLQQYFNYHVLQAEQDLYQREALLWNPIDLPNNQDCIDLFTRKPYGIFAILDSTCVQPKGNDVVFTTNLFKRFKYHPKLRKVQAQSGGGRQKKKINGFTIKHYAGAVLYNCEEFLVKNSDASEFDTTELMYNSTSKISKSVLLMRPDGSMAKDAPKRSHKRAFLSTGSVFADQLASLMKELRKTSPYFVRCVKPNPQKKPRHFIGDFVRPQLRCGGLIEALRIIKLGFPTRCKYSRVHELFGSIFKSDPITNLNHRDFTQAVMTVVGDKSTKPGPSDYQMGLSAIFFRPGKQTWLTAVLDKPVSAISASMAAEIRQFIVKKRWVRAAGLTKGWMRTRTFLEATRFAKASTTMVVYYRTFGRILRKARNVLNGVKEEEEARRRAQDAEFQAALAAKKQLEEMKKLKDQQLAELEQAKAAAKQQVKDKENEITASKEANRATRKEFSEFKTSHMQEKTKLLEEVRTGREKLTESKKKLTEASEEALLQKSNDMEKGQQIQSLERDLVSTREAKEALERNLGEGKDAYERQLTEKDSKISDLEAAVAKMEKEKGEGKDHYEGILNEKNQKLAGELETVSQKQTELKEAQAQAQKEKNQGDETILARNDELEKLKAEVKQLEADIAARQEASRKAIEAAREALEKSESERKAEAAKAEAAIADKDAQVKKQQDDLKNFREVVVKENEAKVKAMKAELEKGRGDAKKAMEKAVADGEKAKASIKKQVAKLETDLARKTEVLATAKKDMETHKTANASFKQKLAEPLDELKKSVSLQHKLEHQTAMNEAVAKFASEITELEAQVAEVEKELEVARSWRKNKGSRR